MPRVHTTPAFKVGQTIHPISNPALKLVIRRYVDQIYYCQDPEQQSRKEFAFFEKEIAPLID